MIEISLPMKIKGPASDTIVLRNDMRWSIYRSISALNDESIYIDVYSWSYKTFVSVRVDDSESEKVHLVTFIYTADIPLLERTGIRKRTLRKSAIATLGNYYGRLFDHRTSRQEKKTIAGRLENELLVSLANYELYSSCVTFTGIHAKLLEDNLSTADKLGLMWDSLQDEYSVDTEKALTFIDIVRSNALKREVK